VFCGYSFPDADIHVKYLAKRAQKNLDHGGASFRVLLANSFVGKLDEAKVDERRRFQRFFGKDHVYDLDVSFEQFAASPQLYLEQ
jgi:hypothetical protein